MKSPREGKKHKRIEREQQGKQRTFIQVLLFGFGGFGGFWFGFDVKTTTTKEKEN